MNDLTIGLLSALLATNQPEAVSNVIRHQTGVSVQLSADPIKQELREVMIADDAAQDEVNDWIKAFSASGTNQTQEAKQVLNQRIRDRFDQVRKKYDQFLRNHPNYADAYLAYGSFLNDIGDPDEAKVQYENAKQLDPKNPAVWNNLANYYGEFSPVTNAFTYYAEAIRLNPSEPVYYQNFATTVYLFRKDAREFFNLSEQQVFDKALGLYQAAMKLAPHDFVLATDYAESYYGIRPLRTNAALMAWTNAMNVAATDAERQGVELHLARIKIAAGRFDEARAHINAVTNTAYFDLKQRLMRSLEDHAHPAASTVDAEGSATNPPVAPAAVSHSAAAGNSSPNQPPPQPAPPEAKTR